MLLRESFVACAISLKIDAIKVDQSASDFNICAQSNSAYFKISKQVKNLV